MLKMILILLLFNNSLLYCGDFYEVSCDISNWKLGLVKLVGEDVAKSLGIDVEAERKALHNIACAKYRASHPDRLAASQKKASASRDPDRLVFGQPIKEYQAKYLCDNNKEINRGRRARYATDKEEKAKKEGVVATPVRSYKKRTIADQQVDPSKR